MADGSYDYIIIGSGIAGLYAALLAREHGSVLVLTKGSIDDCNTRWAQGGIAAPLGPGGAPGRPLRHHPRRDPPAPRGPPPPPRHPPRGWRLPRRPHRAPPLLRGPP